MEDTGFVRLPVSLDPTAQEFRPTNPYHVPLVHPQVYHPYPPPYQSAEVQAVMPGNLGLHQYGAPPPAYVRPAAAEPPLPPPLPPPSSTPSRTLLLSSVPGDVSESTIRRELEVFGDVRAVGMERARRDGVVTVHFYDVRHAEAALAEVRRQHVQQQCRMRRHFDAVLITRNSLFEQYDLPPPLPPPARGLISGRAVWAQFMTPVAAGLLIGHNQGTIVIFNLDANVSSNHLKQIFEAFGLVKELRETPMKRNQRFVEFYDTRDAAKALAEMNGKEINGKQVVIEFSRPGGHSTKFVKSTHYPSESFNSTTSDYTNRSRQPPPLAQQRSPPFGPPRFSNNPQSQSCTKKSSSGKGNPNGKGGGVRAAMSSLCLGSDGIEVCNSKRAGPKKVSKKGNCPSSVVTVISKKGQPLSKGSKPWKGSRHCKEFDSRFLIKEDAIVESNCRDSRTTVMIKNIPNKYSQKLVLNMLDNHCIACNEQIADGGDNQPLSSYDFVYLPIDFINKCNVGYGFVNMTSPEATLRLYKAFHHQNWEVFNSRKICEVTYARLQGVEALKEHFKNSKFPCEAEEYMPVVFSPPRDGWQLTDPVAIVGRPITLLPTAVSPQEDDDGSEVDGNDDDDDDVMEAINGGYLPEEEDLVEESGCRIDVNHNDGPAAL
ncbi:hypothetical protein RJ639_042560 [Escallonia herrerae]|uniref:RRM domain-containing protein n=1 Tax=Escallonia herrerae TaxID=1293975 RepID=A0AA89B503_9ASTE|nr:hypothetical protein RJ639_042560 [Escallonia herrerae]